jgi:APA family basic amino acid/polyamine antiporter
MLPRVTESEAGAHPHDRLERQLGLTDAAMLVVASVIGAGIFFTPGQVAELLPAPGWILAAWAAGALLSLAGALANAELGAMFPRAGGDYVYLREAFHPAAGFMVGWLSFFAIYAGTIAALALAFAEGLGGRLGWGESAVVAFAVAMTIAVSVLNFVGVRWGARANNLTSLVKIAALLAFALFGPWLGDGSWSRVTAGAAPGAAAISATDFGRALSPVLFSYLGWNASVYVASEIRSPGRNVPRSLFLGLAICAGIYMLVNVVYLYALPMSALRGVSDAGQAAALALFGPISGGLVAAFVLISVLGTLNATVLVGPRIAYAMALDGLFFRGVDRVHATFRTPSMAIAVQGLVSVALLLLLRSFPSALDFTVFAIVLATMADVLALYRLRSAQPDRPRPYRAWGHPWVPAAYLLANLGIAAALLIGSPRDCAISLAVLLTGWPVYALFVRSRRRGAGAGGDGPDSPVG